MNEKYQFVADHVSQYAVAVLCRVLGVARSGYYAWRNRAESQRSRNNRTLADQIRRIHTASRETNGSPRIHAELRVHGVRCSQKRVARVMRLTGIAAKHVRRTKRTTNSSHSFPVAPNDLNRAFTASAPNTKWVADITSIATAEGWL
jgi:transposase InsO family protein